MTMNRMRMTIEGTLATAYLMGLWEPITCDRSLAGWDTAIKRSWPCLERTTSVDVTPIVLALTALGW
jgi:hypothetical protein